ncbi:DUF7344 domain-containing protein [Halorussus caseinilyticus]|uniref:DUF7344 domain-containing protein n=1 Tax=Halorussus caseinilyticus TaxID=3034025 RepID=UPI0023E85B6F|nr:hypothetical protein [Halorussus sp. DT72]
MDFETAFDLLSNEHRRLVVAALDETGPVSRRQLTTELLARLETGDSDRTTRRQLRIALHHNHLPRLADAGVVKYDDGTVVPSPKLSTVRDWLEDANRDEDAPETAASLGDHLTAFYA